MTARDMLEKVAARQEWNTDSMLEIVCQYIDNQDDPDTFADFLNNVEVFEVEVFENEDFEDENE